MKLKNVLFKKKDNGSMISSGNSLLILGVALCAFYIIIAFLLEY